MEDEAFFYDKYIYIYIYILRKRERERERDDDEVIFSNLTPRRALSSVD